MWKERDKVKDWSWHQEVSTKLWLYRHALVASLVFVGLNAVDGWLTNYAHNLVSHVAIAQSVEANPFMQPAVGHWALGFKGLLGVGAFAVLAQYKKWSPNKLFAWLMFGCLVFAGVIIWNLHSLGMIL